jgi:glycosyltransferase involved in cell wall biosynthesis
MNTDVSVIVPTYNGSEFILETVKSILSQTYSPQEIILIDDGSPDNTREIVENIHPKVKYHRIPNSGICNARNMGAFFADSPYIAFCDHDDLWRSDKLQKQMSLHDQYPEMQYSFTNYSIVSKGHWSAKTKFDDAPKGFFDDFSLVDGVGFVSEYSVYDRILKFQPIFPSTVLMRKIFFDELGGFNKTFGRNPAEDLEFTLRCVRRTPIGMVSEPVVGIRKHSTNFSGNSYANICGRIEILNYVLAHHSISDTIKAVLLEQIAIGRVEASHKAFALGDFFTCRSLLTEVPHSYFDSKTRMKLMISKFPDPVAKLLHKILSL